MFKWEEINRPSYNENTEEYNGPNEKFYRLMLIPRLGLSIDIIECTDSLFSVVYYRIFINHWEYEYNFQGTLDEAKKYAIKTMLKPLVEKMSEICIWWDNQ